MIKESIVTDICDALHRIMSNNVTTLKELRSLIGKLEHAAKLLIPATHLGGIVRQISLHGPPQDDAANHYFA